MGAEFCSLCNHTECLFLHHVLDGGCLMSLISSSSTQGYINPYLTTGDRHAFPITSNLFEAL